MKHPNDTALKGHVPLTVAFEVDYAEFLDEALVECFEFHESFSKPQREWWVLKPGMSDQGQGIRLFSSEDELRAVFEEWEGAEGVDDEDADEDNDNADEEAEDTVTPASGTETPVLINNIERIGAGTMTSQLRHFIAQRYIDPPLLFPEHGNRKFHIRTYVLAVGALRVYVYRDMLALFAPQTYRSPGPGGLEPEVHLTNTCLHSGTPLSGSVHPFWNLPSTCSYLRTSGNPASDWKSTAFSQLCRATGTLFEAAAREQMVHFQTLGNAFEVFGLDWMVDAGGGVWLLEVNAFPDFRQSGEGLRGLVGGFWEGVVSEAVETFFGVGGEERRESDRQGGNGMVKVLDVDLGRR